MDKAVRFKCDVIYPLDDDMIKRRMTPLQAIYANLYDYVFDLWDGIHFFGFAHYKLRRQKGQPPRWYDRFMDKSWVLTNVTIGTIIVHTLYTKVG